MRPRTTSQWKSSSSSTTSSSGSNPNRKEASPVAVERDRPYAQFNFLVDLGTGSMNGPQAGFRECSEIGMTVDVIEYRNGDESAYRTVTIQLMSEDHTQVAETWKLLRARPVRHVTGPFNAQCSDVAIEELTLAYERLELE